MCLFFLATLHPSCVPTSSKGPSAVKTQNPNHWTAREVPRFSTLKVLFSLSFHAVPLWKEVTISCPHFRCGELHITFHIFPSLCFLFLLLFFFFLNISVLFGTQDALGSSCIFLVTPSTLFLDLDILFSSLTFLVMRTFKSYSLGCFQINNTVLLTIVTVPYVTSPWLSVLFISLANLCSLWDLSALSKDWTLAPGSGRLKF